MSHRIRKIAALGVAAALALSGCGGSDSGGGTPNAAPTDKVLHLSFLQDPGQHDLYQVAHVDARGGGVEADVEAHLPGVEGGAEGVEVVMLTGDNDATAGAIAREAGISEVYADLRPEDKSAIIERLLRAGQSTAMAQTAHAATKAPTRRRRAPPVPTWPWPLAAPDPTPSMSRLLLALARSVAFAASLLNPATS